MNIDAESLVLFVKHAAMRELTQAMGTLNEQLRHTRGLELVVEVAPERDPATGALYFGFDVYEGAQCHRRVRMDFTPRTLSYPQPMSRRVFSEFQTWCDPASAADCHPVGVYYDEDPPGAHFLCLHHYAPLTGYVERSKQTR